MSHDNTTFKGRSHYLRNVTDVRYGLGNDDIYIVCSRLSFSYTVLCELRLIYSVHGGAGGEK